VDKELYAQMVDNFETKFTPIWTEKVFSKEVPSPLDQLFKDLSDAKQQRELTGKLEAGGAAGLLVGGLFGISFVKWLSLFLLMGVFVAATMTHIWLEEDPSPPATLLIVLLLVAMTAPARRRVKAKDA